MKKFQGWILFLIAISMGFQWWGCAHKGEVILPPAKASDPAEKVLVDQGKLNITSQIDKGDKKSASGPEAVISLESKVEEPEFVEPAKKVEKSPLEIALETTMTGPLDFHEEKVLVDQGKLNITSQIDKGDKKSASGPEAVISLESKVEEPEFVEPAKKVEKSPLEIALETTMIGLIDFHEEKLSNVLKAISGMTGVNFMVKKKEKGKEGKVERGDEEIEHDMLETKITIFFKDISLESAIKILCEQYMLSFSIKDDYVLIMRQCDIPRIDYICGNRPGSEGTIKRLEFKGLFLEDALMAFSKKTGRNVICKKNISYIPIWIAIKDVPVITAIETICKKYNLWYKENKEKGYICLINVEDFSDEMGVDYQIKTRIFNLKYASAPQLADSIACVMGSRVEYELPRNLRSYEHIKFPDVTDEEGHIEESKAEAEITEQIEIPEFEEALTSDKIEQLLAKRMGFRITAKDIRWINKEVGFAIITIFLRNNSIIASSTDERLLEEIEKIIRKTDTPTSQVLIECRILSVNLTDNFTSFFQITNFEYRRKGGESYGEKTQIFNVPYFGAAGSQVLYNFVDDKWKFDAEMKLLKDEGVMNITSTPMIIAAQNTEAVIESGMENFPFFKDMDVVRPVVEENNIIPGYAIPTYDRVAMVGTTLKITPQINEDKSVTLKIYIERSGVKKAAAEIRYPVFSDQGTVTDLLTEYVDVKERESINTIIIVPENNTLALGGLVKEEESVEESKVPFLGDLPLIGFFFKELREIKQRTETVFLLTPHIIMSPGEAGGVTKKIIEGMEHPIIKEGKKKLLEFDEK